MRVASGRLLHVALDDFNELARAIKRLAGRSKTNAAPWRTRANAERQVGAILTLSVTTGSVVMDWLPIFFFAVIALAIFSVVAGVWELTRKYLPPKGRKRWR